jgi:MFS family permease
LRAAFGSGRVWALAFVYFTLAVALYGVNFWMPTIIQELGLARTAYLQVGLLSMIPWGIAGASMLWWGQHSDRTGERRWHVTAALLCTTAGLAGLAVVGTHVVASLVASPRMTSTNCITGTGFMKCIPMTWSGRFVRAAISVMEIELVLLARMAPAGAN